MSYSPSPSKLAARPFSGKKNSTRVPKLLNANGLYGKSLVTRIDAPSGPKVSRFLDLFRRQRRFVRPTAYISLRNCSPYVRLNGTSSVSCGTVGFLTPRLTAEHYISEPQLSISDKIIGLNSLALYLLFIYLERKDARCSLLCPESSIQRSVLDRLGNVLGFDRFSSFQVGNSSGYFENSIVGAGSQPLLGHSPL